MVLPAQCDRATGRALGLFFVEEWYVINSFLFWTKLAGSERSERRAPCSLSVESMRTSHQVSIACARTSPDEPAAIQSARIAFVSVLP